MMDLDMDLGMDMILYPDQDSEVEKTIGNNRFFFKNQGFWFFLQIFHFSADPGSTRLHVKFQFLRK